MIARAALLAPVEHEYDAVKAENDWTSAQVAKYPDRLSPSAASTR